MSRTPFWILALLVACTKTTDETAQQPTETGTTETETEPPLPGDGDGDGVVEGEDCDDGDDGVFPGATERCNGVDDDCDSLTDEPGSADEATWYTDADGDGFGDDATAVQACDAPKGMIAVGGDCDDGANAIYPGHAEVCDGVDEDCDGTVDDEPTDGSPWYQDLDGDGYGDPAVSVNACAAPLDGWWVPDAGDCDDGTNAMAPGLPEYCDGVDNDCDGGVDDEPTNGDRFWPDADGDGVGAESGDVVTCGAPDGFVGHTGDCDDSDDDVFPGNTEACDGEDNDCDAIIDEVEEARDALRLYADADGDGYGDDATLVLTCAPVPDMVDVGGDCDETNPAINPGAAEVCFDGVDNDCAAGVDDGGAVDATTFYKDDDGDGFGDPLVARPSCSEPRDHVLDASDCDDTDPLVYPGAEEVPCSGKTEDCGGPPVVDEDVGVPTDYPTISDALAAAPDGALVCVHEGTYSEALTLSRPVTLVGWSGAPVILDAAGGPTVTITGSDITLRAVTITGTGATDGQAITLDGASRVTVHDVTVDGQSAARGGAIYASGGSDITIRDATFTGNTASVGGGALYAVGVTGLDLYGNTWTANSAPDGGAVLLDGCSGTLDGDTFTANAATNAGGALSVVDGAPYTVRSALVSGNTAEIGGGLHATGGVLVVEDGEYTGNIATSGAGMAWLDGTGWALTSTTLEANSATDGGGIYLARMVDTTLVGLLSLDNLAVTGGGLLAEACTGLSLESGRVTGNQASGEGGGVMLRDSVDVTLTQGRVSNNLAAYGAGVFVRASDPVQLDSVKISTNAASVDGGGVYCEAGSVTGNATYLDNTPNDHVCDACNVECPGR